MTRSVDVVEVPLGDGVVDGDDGVAQVAGGGHGSQAVHAGGRFFGTTDDALSVFGLVTVNANDEVGSVVKGERGLELEGLVDAPVEVLGGLTVPSVNGVTFAGKPGSNFVLGRERVAARPGDFSACGTDGFDEHGRFLGHVKAASDAHASERLGALGFFLEFCQHGHAGTSPVHQKSAVFGQPHVSNGVIVTLVQFIHGRPTCSPLLNSIVSPQPSTDTRKERCSQSRSIVSGRHGRTCVLGSWFDGRSLGPRRDP